MVLSNSKVDPDRAQLLIATGIMNPFLLFHIESTSREVHEESRRLGTRHLGEEIHSTVASDERNGVVRREDLNPISSSRLPGRKGRTLNELAAFRSPLKRAFLITGQGSVVFISSAKNRAERGSRIGIGLSRTTYN